jgi:GPI transamidase subunit PIG-U
MARGQGATSCKGATSCTGTANGTPEMKRSFVRSRLAVIVTMIRLCLLFNILLPCDLLDWLSSANLRSVLMDPVHTMDHVREAMAIRHLSPLRRTGLGNASAVNSPAPRSLFVDAYRGHETGHSRIHLPPLALAAMESILAMTGDAPYTVRSDNEQLSSTTASHGYWAWIAISIFGLLVDVWIGTRLERLTFNTLAREANDPSELDLMQHMNPRIVPPLTHLFPMNPLSKFPTTNGTTSSPSSSSVMSGTASCWLQWNDLPFYVAHLYYSNPITVLAVSSSAATSYCFQNVGLACLVTALAECSTPRPLLRSGSAARCDAPSSATMAAFGLAVATYLDVHCVVFLIPMAIWIGAGRAKTLGVLWDFYTCCLQGLSLLLVGGDNFCSIFATTHLHQFALRGQPPSLSMLWYFGMQMFARFRSYFEFLLGGFPYLLVVPVTIRLHRYPSVLVRLNGVDGTPLTQAPHLRVRPFLLVCAGGSLLDVADFVSPTVHSVFFERGLVFPAREPAIVGSNPSNLVTDCTLRHSHSGYTVHGGLLDVARARQW